ncbi:hypothetical protein ACFL6M_07525 [Candidatus Eisenbacteria bacterium]|uniref:Uncharacterized protein n=1 Tax=Eiseniibacteriota bacterium TaxID=2212470 RepID=A0ABV6YM92_UNCEI
MQTLILISGDIEPCAEFERNTTKGGFLATLEADRSVVDFSPISQIPDAGEELAHFAHLQGESKLKRGGNTVDLLHVIVTEQLDPAVESYTWPEPWNVVLRVLCARNGNRHA